MGGMGSAASVLHKEQWMRYMQENRKSDHKRGAKLSGTAQWDSCRSRWAAGKLRMRAAVDTCTLALPALRSLMAREHESV